MGLSGPLSRASHAPLIVSVLAKYPTTPARQASRHVSLVAAIALLVLVLLSSCAGSPANRTSAAPSAARGAIVSVAPMHPGTAFTEGSVGLSLEADEIGTRDLNAAHRSLVGLMRMLGPGVLRLGGNSLDYSWWTSAGESPPSWATSVVTPDYISMLHGLLLATGWRAILGLDLGHFDPSRAANEAAVATRILGSSLLGFEIGNEPNDYGHPLVGLRPSSYSASDYLQEISAYAAAMRGAVPSLRLYGPDLGTPPSAEWLTAIASAINQPFAVITQHYYPTTYSLPRGACQGTPIPTALELLSPEVRERENAALRTILAAGQLAKRETVISETNATASCDASGGPATSPVFASALWSLDWVLRAASAGITGLDFHGYFGRCAPHAGSPVCAPSATDEARGEVTARPEYYGLLAARQLEGGAFVPVSIMNEGAWPDLTAYATVHARSVLTVAIDNLGGAGPIPLVLKAPGYRSARGATLAAASVDATEGVSFGHASFGAGARGPLKLSHLQRADGSFRFVLTPASAIIVTLRR